MADRKDEWFKLDPGGAKIAVPVYMGTGSSQEACKSWDAYVASQLPERKQAGARPRMVAYPPCIMCGDEEHAAVRCEIKDKNTRFKLFMQKKMCFQCGNKGCSATTCPHPMQCKTCQGTDRKKHSSILCFIEELNTKQQRQFKERADKPRFTEAPQVRRKPTTSGKPIKKEFPKGIKLTGFQKGTPASRVTINAGLDGASSDSESGDMNKEEEEPAQEQPSREPLDPDMVAAQILHLQELHRQATDTKKEG